MSDKKKKVTVETTVKVTQPEAKLPPNAFPAVAIHTGTGAGLLVEARNIDEKPVFVMTHLGTGACIPTGIEGATALCALLAQWIMERDNWSKAEWSLAT